MAYRDEVKKTWGSDHPVCLDCGCPGNLKCLYPPKQPDDIEDCSLDGRGSCYCCGEGIDRMNYRPEEDGQIDMFSVKHEN